MTLYLAWAWFATWLIPAELDLLERSPGLEDERFLMARDESSDVHVYKRLESQCWGGRMLFV